MDRTLMEGDPFRLLEGISIAAYAIGSNRAYIYIRSEYKDAIRRINNAIKNIKRDGTAGGQYPGQWLQSPNFPEKRPRSVCLWGGNGLNSQP